MHDTIATCDDTEGREEDAIDKKNDRFFYPATRRRKRLQTISNACEIGAGRPVDKKGFPEGPLDSGRLLTEDDFAN